MPRRFVDLSIVLENSPLSDPPAPALRIAYQTHRDTLKEFVQLLHGTKAGTSPDCEAGARDRIRVPSETLGGRVAF